MEEGSLLADVLDSVVFVLKLIVANPQSSKDYISATRGVVVRERGGTRSGNYFGAGTALRQISLATGRTLTLKRSGKSRRPRSVYFLAQIAPKRGIWHQKSQQIFRG